MIAKTNSATVLGLDAHPVDVEVDVSIGLSTFNIVGLSDGTIKESRDRVTAAVTNSGFNFPVRRIVVNLAPAVLWKIGSGFDLPIALALLGALRYFPEQVLEKVMVVGELSLDVAIRPIRGILPVAVAARDHAFDQLILPKANEAEAAVVEEVRRVPVSTLDEVVRYLQGKRRFNRLPITPAGFLRKGKSFAKISRTSRDRSTSKGRLK